MRPCYAFKAATAADEPETLSIYDEIGLWGVHAKDFIAGLGKVQSKTLNVEINSPGGDVFAALAMYNALRASGKEIVVKVMGVAASAASLIAMAGDKIVMPKNTFMMVHNPWTFVMGNADELREQADTLDKIGASLKATYAAKTGMDDTELDAMLATDTWLSADEALAKGFATEVVDEIKAQAKFDMARADLPAHVALAFAPTAPDEDSPAGGENEDADDSSVQPATPVAEQIEALADGAGFGMFAAHWALSCKGVDEVTARIATAREVRALCAVAKRPADTEAFIKDNASVDAVRAALVTALAAADEATHTDTARKEKQATGETAQSKVSPASLWAAHSGQTLKGK